ncbi:patatin family protein [Bacillaceae bacterium IKA-2]|nr:patatin family protein [Bacillaceae bacterium IKA-2]
MKNIGLVLQGGGMRGVYTSGVLDFFMEQELYFPYISAVSAGACNASAYLSRQHGLGKIMHINFLRDPRYISIRNLFKHRSLLGMDFIFDEIPKTIHPFDFKRFNDATEHLVVAATDCEKGECCYFDNKISDHIFMAIRASCSLPFISHIVDFDGLKLLDGGITAPIPINKSISDGHDKNVIILTNTNQNVRPLNLKWLAQKIYSQYGHLVKALIDHHEVYKTALLQIKQLEAINKVFVIRPTRDIPIRTIERNITKLELLYDQGYEDAKNSYTALLGWMSDE